MTMMTDDSDTKRRIIVTVTKTTGKKERGDIMVNIKGVTVTIRREKDTEMRRVERKEDTKVMTGGGIKTMMIEEDIKMKTGGGIMMKREGQNATQIKKNANLLKY